MRYGLDPMREYGRTRSPKLIQHVIPETCERGGDDAIDCLHGRKQPRMLRDPRFSGTRRHGHTDSNPALENEPRRESFDQVPTAVIHDMKIVAGESCGTLAVLHAPQRIVPPAT